LSKSFILTSVIPLLLLGVIVLYYLLVSYTAEVKEKNQLLARAISGQIKAELSSPLAILDNLRYQLDKEQLTTSSETLQHLLDQHAENKTFFDSIYLLSAEGSITLVGLGRHRLGMRPEFIGLNLAHLDFYQQAVRNYAISWSNTFHSLISSSTALAVCVPLRDGRAIIGNIRIDFLQTLVQKVSHGQRVTLSILDQRGEVVARSDPNQRGQASNLLHLLLVQQGLNGKEGSALFVKDGISQLGSVSLIEGPAWVTLISQPTEAAYRAVSQAGMLFGIGLVGAILLAMALAMFQARRMAQPFLELAQQVEVISGGEYQLAEISQQYLEVTSLDEGFRAMAGAIREREDALRQRERDYRTLAENLPAIVYRILVQQHNQLTLLDRYQERMTGFSHAEVVAGGVGFFASRIDPTDFPGIRSQIAEAINRKQPYNVEYGFYHKDGGCRHFIERGTPVFDEEQTLLFLDGVVLDNSEQYRAKEILLQTEKMMSVGSLAAGMAHEINNPLAGILLNMELLRQRLNPGRPANSRRADECRLELENLLRFFQLSKIDNMLDAIEEAAKRTAKIVENVLSFSRKGTGNFTEQPVVALIEQTLQLAEHNFDIKKGFDFRRIKIQRNYAANLPAIRCEPSQIQQVLLNLLENGAQAMFLETAALRNPVFTISATTNGAYLCLEIGDNGPGMDEAVRRRIFEPFFTTKETGQGTGLGLSVSYFIVSKNHLGTMSVESIPGVGSTFSVCLPYHRKEPKKVKQL
jgi:PAS domain S-box-containing protein